MAELTTEQIVKIVIGVFVLIVVITGAYFIFKERIHGYFSGLAGNDELDLSIEAQQLLFVDKNIIGYVDERGERGLFGTSKPISLTGTKGEKQRTSYYFWKNTGKIYEDKTWRDILVGAIERGRININPEYLGRRELAAIHGGVWRSGAIYREVLR
ncbi:MAG TPA: hypothetical protein VJK03_00170 [Candidatus Nanoarchaeia archaeon]|nr:hypothetical protein [Candidatus Nanoarchaeia archaeon]